MNYPVATFMIIVFDDVPVSGQLIIKFRFDYRLS